jgi:hypothetical protein
MLAPIETTIFSTQRFVAFAGEMKRPSGYARMGLSYRGNLKTAPRLGGAAATHAICVKQGPGPPSEHRSSHKIRSSALYAKSNTRLVPIATNNRDGDLQDSVGDYVPEGVQRDRCTRFCVYELASKIVTQRCSVGGRGAGFPQIAVHDKQFFCRILKISTGIRSQNTGPFHNICL